MEEESISEEQKNKAYLEAEKLKKAGFNDGFILARLEARGIPDDIALDIIRKLTIQERAEKRR